MSISLNLYYTGKNGNARRFAEKMEQSGTADMIRGERGCLRYEYFLPVNDPETVLLIDVWENQQAIDRHHGSEMMKTVAELREKYDLRMRAERYVSDESGIPEKDGKFLRT
ncbi:MAG: antibiotic biosynthesis monooxygenase [Ruminococcus sp.]|nr:antibiotic biosynthesis monooxygenase [Ruminococcus sp.]MCM1381990.1 antibiotic biosynthesis monooxygenase [Muribaculaceae bacterium]MCM1478950.1 antibiotic biosynthesis monooxygenase [Muribaculaceae bacterium]